MICCIFCPQKSWNSCFGNSNQFCWIFHCALECSSAQLGTAYRNSLQKVCPFASRQNAFHVCALLLMFNYSEAFSWNGLGSWTVVRRKKFCGLFSQKLRKENLFFWRTLTLVWDAVDRKMELIWPNEGTRSKMWEIKFKLTDVPTNLGQEFRKIFSNLTKGEKNRECLLTF